MSYRLHKIVGLGVLAIFGPYWIFEALRVNLLDYFEFEKSVAVKKPSYVYLLDDKAWFFETIRIIRTNRTLKWETHVTDKDRLVAFLKLNNVNLITNPSFIDVHWNLIWCFISMAFFYCVWIFYTKYFC